MEKMTISTEKLDKVLSDVENLVEDVEAMIDQDSTARKRLEELKKDPSIAVSEEEIDSYLKKRGVKVD